MAARGEGEIDSLLYSLRQTAESQLKKYKDYFGPKHHEMQARLQGFLSGISSWSEDFPHVVSIPHGKGHTAAARRVLRHHNTVRIRDHDVLPCELGGIGRIPVRHDYFAKQEPTIVPIGGYVSDCHATSVRALRGKSLNRKNAKHHDWKVGVDVCASSPHIRDCHVILEKIPKKKLREAIQPHMQESDEGSSCFESSCDSDYLPLDAKEDCLSSDGEEEDGETPLVEENLLQSTGDGSLNHQTSDGRDILAQMDGMVKDCSTANEAETFVEDDSTQLPRACCMDEEIPYDQQSLHSAVEPPSSPSTAILSGPGECGQMTDNDSLPGSMADSDLPPNSPSLLGNSNDMNSSTTTDKEACVADGSSITRSISSTSMVSNSESDMKVNNNIADTEVITEDTDTRANEDVTGTERNGDIMDTIDNEGLANTKVNDGITDIACSEGSPASSRDDPLLFSQHANLSSSPLTLDLAHSTCAISGCSPILNTGLLEDDASQLSSYWQSSPGDPCTPPLPNLRDCTQSSPELLENHMDTSDDLFAHSRAEDSHHRLLLLSSKSEAEVDTLLSASAVSTSPPGSTLSTPITTTNIKREHSYVSSSHPVSGLGDDLDESSVSSRSAPPEMDCRRGKSMKLLKHRRLLSSPSLSPLQSSLSSGVGQSKHEPPLTPKAKRPCIWSAEDALEDQHSVEAKGRISADCKAQEEATDRDELPCFSPEAPLRQQEEEGSSSASVVPSSPLEGNATHQVDGKSRAKSAADASRDEIGVSSTTGQTPTTRLRMVRGRKSRHGSCIACGIPFLLNSGYDVVKHPKLDAFMCQKCHTFYFSGDFSYSGDKQNECFVCGEGGKIVECDTPGQLCPHSVCLKCVRRLEGGVKAKQLQSDEGADFFCYECDPGPIQHLLSEFKRGSLTLGWRVNEEEVKKDFEKNQLLDTSNVGSPERDGPSRDVQRQDVSVESSNTAAGKPDDASEDPSKRCLKDSHGIDHESECDSHSSDLDSTSSSDHALSSDDDISDLQLSAKMSGSKEKNCLRDKVMGSEKVNVAAEEVDGAGNSSKEGMSKQQKQDKNAIVRQTFTNKHTWRKGSSSGAGSESGAEFTGHDSEILEGVEEEGEGEGGGLEAEMQAESPKNDECVSKKKTSGKKKINHFLDDTSSEDELRQLKIDLSEKPEEEVQAEQTYEDIPEVKYTTQRRAAQMVSSSDSELEDGYEPEGGTKQEAPEVAEGSKEEDEVDEDRVDQILSDAQKKTKDKKRHRRKGRVPRARYKFLDSDLEDEEEDGEDNYSIIVLSDNSESDKDKEAETPPSQKKDVHARRNIRKIMPKQKLTALTKQAQKEEQDRQKRLKERGEVDLRGDRLILEGTEEEPVLEVRRSLVPSLKPHQREGVRFLWDYTCESVDKIKDGKGSGALLAHCMGLGKTLQVIAFLDTLLHNDVTGFKRMLVIVPKNTISNWVDEFQRWLKDENDYCVINFNQYKNKFEQSQVIESWSLRGGVGIVSYDTYRILTSVKGKRTARQCERLKNWLRDPGPDVVVCDEGHVLRNYKSALSQAVNQVATQRRIVLTGTPLQNNLQEYYTMVSFVKPNLLGTLKEFNNRFGNPIKNGQCRDATSFDVVLMKRRAHVLNRLLSGCVQRKDYRVLTECLPSKHEYVLKIRLSPVQEQLYCALLEQRGSDGVIQSIFKFFQVMIRIWNHPWMLRLYEERMEYDEDDDDSGSNLGGFICDDSELEEELAEIARKAKKKKGKRKKRGSSRSSCSTPSVSSVSAPTSPCPVVPTKGSDEVKAEPSAVGESSVGPSMMSSLVHVNNVGSSSSDPVIVDLTGDSEGKPHDVCEPEGKPNGLWYDKLLSDEMEHMIELSGKMLFLRELLVETKRLGEKVLVFSQSLLTLDVIEHFLHSAEFGHLTPDLDYFRLDGATAANERATMTRSFNCHKEKRVRLFLISTRAGSLGINLVSANRVVIFDACWNPSHDLQALFRVYRYGQTKPVFIYRLIAKGTMEEKIYDRQVTKEAIALRVVDKKQIDRHFSTADMAELLVYTPAPPPQDMVGRERPEADPLLCGILDKLQPDWLLSYHCHDSLLVHREFEELSQTDKDSAWEEYLSSVRQVEGQAYYTFAGMPREQGAHTSAGVDSFTVGVPTGQQPMQPLQLQQLQQHWRPGMLLPTAALQQQQPPHLLSSGAVLNQMQGASSTPQIMTPHTYKVLSATALTIRQMFQQSNLTSDLYRLSLLSRQGNKQLMLQLRDEMVKKLNEQDSILKQIKERLHGISALGPVVTNSPEFLEVQSVIADTSQVLFTYSTQLQRLMSTV